MASRWPLDERRGGLGQHLEEDFGEPAGAARPGGGGPAPLLARCAAHWRALTPGQKQVSLACAGLLAGMIYTLAVIYQHAHRPVSRPAELPKCNLETQCPAEWATSGGGYFCPETGGCRAGADLPFDLCPKQCYLGDPETKRLPPATRAPAPSPAGGMPAAKPGPGGPGKEGDVLTTYSLERAGKYSLRALKAGKLLGCYAPIGLFPGHDKYGCGGNFSTAKTCDAAKHPVKDTLYVAAVHAGCETKRGRGTYGYAYDDGVGLKQCAPVTRYEWILCPDPRKANQRISWKPLKGLGKDSTKRFRVRNDCSEAVWVQQAGMKLPHEQEIRPIAPGASYTYSVPNEGLPSTRFLPKTGCDRHGNNCDVQSMPPCPPQGCDAPIDTKFEATWGCRYATGNRTKDKIACHFTGQGAPATYQDWWDGSAVDGWTLPFTVLVDDSGWGLAPGTNSSNGQCGNVVCAELNASEICPEAEFLTPEA